MPAGTATAPAIFLTAASAADLTVLADGHLSTSNRKHSAMDKDIRQLPPCRFIDGSCCRPSHHHLAGTLLLRHPFPVNEPDALKFIYSHDHLAIPARGWKKLLPLGHTANSSAFFRSGHSRPPFLEYVSNLDYTLFLFLCKSFLKFSFQQSRPASPTIEDSQAEEETKGLYPLMDADKEVSNTH